MCDTSLTQPRRKFTYKYLNIKILQVFFYHFMPPKIQLLIHIEAFLHKNNVSLPPNTRTNLYRTYS